MDLNQQISYLLAGEQFHANLASLRQTIAKLKLIPDYPIILIGGTNGKGSVCAYLNTILTLAGYKVGCFTSPHMFRYNERITINNTPIEDVDLAEALDKVIRASSANPGIFKAFALAAHLYFINKKIDIAVIEVGIGGLNDATNLFEPSVSAITTIDYDHQHILGDTLEEIGLQKAGIFRQGKPAFVAMPDPPRSIIGYARNINSNLKIIGRDFGYIRHDLSFEAWAGNNKYFSLPHPALRGSEQLANASLAIAIISSLKQNFPVPLAAVKTGLLQTSLPGRLSILPGQPQTILDVAHNQQAVSHMLKNMLKLSFAKNNYAVFGIASDKDIVAIINLTKEYFNKWFIAPICSSRNIENAALIRIMQDCKIANSQIQGYASISDAFKAARAICTNDDRIVCFGSFLVVEEVYRCK